jgi:hypothetical protein
LASWLGASIIEIPIKNINRERGASHYGISRTFRVFFDLITIRFLLRYLSRPLHFFGSVGVMSMGAGSIIAMALMAMKVLWGTNVMDAHGPLLVSAAVLIVAGVQLLALGLLGEMQVRHYHEPGRRAPYAIDRVLRIKPSEETAEANN